MSAFLHLPPCLVQEVQRCPWHRWVVTKPLKNTSHAPVHQGLPVCRGHRPHTGRPGQEVWPRHTPGVRGRWPEAGCTLGKEFPEEVTPESSFEGRFERKASSRVSLDLKGTFPYSQGSRGGLHRGHGHTCTSAYLWREPRQ